MRRWESAWQNSTYNRSQTCKRSSEIIWIVSGRTDVLSGGVISVITAARLSVSSLSFCCHCNTYVCAQAQTAMSTFTAHTCKHTHLEIHTPGNTHACKHAHLETLTHANTHPSKSTLMVTYTSKYTHQFN